MQRDSPQDGRARLVSEPDLLDVDGKGTRWQLIHRAVGEARALTEESLDAAETGCRVLQVLHLVADLLRWLPEHFCVAKDQEDRAYGQRTVPVEHGAEVQ